MKFIIVNSRDGLPGQENACMWSKCKTFIYTFQQYWNKYIDITKVDYIRLQKNDQFKQDSQEMCKGFNLTF